VGRAAVARLVKAYARHGNKDARENH